MVEKWEAIEEQAVLEDGDPSLVDAWTSVRVCALHEWDLLHVHHVGSDLPGQGRRLFPITAADLQPVLQLRAGGVHMARRRGPTTARRCWERGIGSLYLQAS